MCLFKLLIKKVTLFVKKKDILCTTNEFQVHYIIMNFRRKLTAGIHILFFFDIKRKKGIIMCSSEK